MRRAWLFFLALLLPLQMASAAVADCRCLGDESTNIVLHASAVDEDSATAHDQDIAADFNGCAPDCGFCNPCWAEPLTTHSVSIPQLSAPPSGSAGARPKRVYGRAPERPNWCGFA